VLYEEVKLRAPVAKKADRRKGKTIQPGALRKASIYQVFSKDNSGAGQRDLSRQPGTRRRRRTATWWSSAPAARRRTRSCGPPTTRRCGKRWRREPAWVEGARKVLARPERMSLESDIFTALRLWCPNRCYPTLPRRTPGRPYIVWQQVGGEAFNFLEAAVSASATPASRSRAGPTTRIAANDLARSAEDALLASS
jgi:hypothetical protein